MWLEKREKIRDGKVGEKKHPKIEVHLFADYMIVYLKTLENHN